MRESINQPTLHGWHSSCIQLASHMLISVHMLAAYNASFVVIVSTPPIHAEHDVSHCMFGPHFEAALVFHSCTPCRNKICPHATFRVYTHVLCTLVKYTNSQSTSIFVWCRKTRHSKTSSPPRLFLLYLPSESTEACKSNLPFLCPPPRSSRCVFWRFLHFVCVSLFGVL